MPRRTFARGVLAMGWLALFATSSIEHEWVIAAEAQTVSVSVAAEMTRTYRLIVEVEGHVQAAGGELYLALGGLDAALVVALEAAWRDDGGLASIGPVGVLGPSAISARSGFRRHGEDDPSTAYFVHATPCEAAPCVRTFDVTFRGVPSAFEATIVFGAGVLGRDVDEPPPGRVTLRAYEVTP